jgi:hypothetical protein
MFAKRTKQISPPQGPNDDGSQTAQSGPDPREVAIERLTRELAEEREVAKGLRESLDATAFKAEVLEKSYAKQLADTRERLAAAEQKLADKIGVLAALDGGHEDALRALNDARAELRLMTADRDELRKQIAEGGFRERGTGGRRAPLGMPTGEATDSGGTINELISNAGWAQKTPATDAGHASARVTEQEAPQEEMLAPELVFTRGKSDGKDEDEER